jgi:hypothetical protein
MYRSYQLLAIVKVTSIGKLLDSSTTIWWLNCAQLNSVTYWRDPDQEGKLPTPNLSMMINNNGEVYKLMQFKYTIV